MSSDYAAKYAAQEANKHADLAATRRALQEKLLIATILDKGPLIFQAEFDGYGDFGQCHAMTGNEEVDKFLTACVHIYVTFDWYNNDGGGGDITWDVRKDKITINGYYNETIQHQEMEEAVF